MHKTQSSESDDFEGKNMSQIVTENTQKLEGFYKIIESSSKYWEIRGNIVNQHEPYGLTPESNELPIEYGDFGKVTCRTASLILMLSSSGPGPCPFKSLELDTEVG